MEIKTGYLYHIKAEFFDIMNDDNLMQNHEKGKTRPTYFTIKDKDILWFVPISSRIEKYKKIINHKIKKFGFCNSILVEKIFDKDAAILLQNTFPTLEKYIDHVHTIDGKPAKVPEKLKRKIYNNFKKLMKLHNRGIKVFFADIDSLKQQIEEKLK